MQNKLLWAATGKTAAELIEARSNADKTNMGLTAWRGSIVRKQDVAIAKNKDRILLTLATWHRENRYCVSNCLETVSNSLELES